MNKFFGFSSTTLVLLTLTMLVRGGWGHNCSNAVTIESQGLLNYLANVSFLAPHNLSGEWRMDFTTDVEYTFLGGWNIWVNNDPSQGRATFRSRQDDLEIQKGDLISFRFRISWAQGKPQPEVISLIWDGEQICGNNDRQSILDVKASRPRIRRMVKRNPRFAKRSN